MKYLFVIILCITSVLVLSILKKINIVLFSKVYGQQECNEKEKLILQKKPKIMMICREGKWSMKESKSKGNTRSGASNEAPCVDEEGNTASCIRDKGHCLQHTVDGKRMEKKCSGTCGQYKIYFIAFRFGLV